MTKSSAVPDPIRHIPMAPPSYFGRLCLSSVALFWALVLPGAAQEVSFRAILSRLAPKDPQQSLACLQVRSGFRVELVCSEPLVSDPIAIDWGPDGRLWVVEMGDYPQGQDDAEMARGRIRFLEDTDHDGRYDRSTVFLDGLSFPTGVMCWENGVLITCAPDLLYAEDVDGDGKADRREVLFRGFVEGNPQHRVNCLRWGLDNWVYGANGDSGGIILSLKTGRQVDIHARDFRLRPDTGVLETQTGMSQYGRCRDDWGNWFGGRNLQPSWHCAGRSVPAPQSLFGTSRPVCRSNGPTHLCASIPSARRCPGSTSSGRSIGSLPHAALPCIATTCLVRRFPAAISFASQHIIWCIDRCFVRRARRTPVAGRRTSSSPSFWHRQITGFDPYRYEPGQMEPCGLSTCTDW